MCSLPQATVVDATAGKKVEGRVAAHRGHTVNEGRRQAPWTWRSPRPRSPVGRLGSVEGDVELEVVGELVDQGGGGDDQVNRRLVRARHGAGDVDIVLQGAGRVQRFPSGRPWIGLYL